MISEINHDLRKINQGLSTNPLREQLQPLSDYSHESTIAVLLDTIYHGISLQNHHEQTRYRFEMTEVERTTAPPAVIQ